MGNSEELATNTVVYHIRGLIWIKQVRLGVLPSRFPTRSKFVPHNVATSEYEVVVSAPECFAAGFHYREKEEIASFRSGKGKNMDIEE